MDLVKEIAGLDREIRETDHIGRHNRLHARLTRLYDRAEASVDSEAIFAALLNHPDAELRLAAAWHCGWRRVFVDAAERTVNGLVGQGGEIGRRAGNWLESRERMASGSPLSTVIDARSFAFPPPPRCHTRDAVIEVINARFSGTRATQLAALIRRAVLLRPVEAAGDPLASRLGGLPMMSSGEAWPQDYEPLVFLGQINCAELFAAVGETPLPAEGLLRVFGDHDDIHGCEPQYDCAVDYRAEMGDLQLTHPPVEDFDPLVTCGLEFHETTELPDPGSNAIEALAMNPMESELYRALYDELYDNGIEYIFSTSKLFGWPNLIQGDLAEYGFPQPDFDLLLQVGEYHDGRTWQSWGPGGVVYLLVNDDALAESNFEDAQIVAQVT